VEIVEEELRPFVGDKRATQPSTNAAKPEIHAAREELKMITLVPESIDRVEVAKRLCVSSGYRLAWRALIKVGPSSSPGSVP
jgi:hypothetical protein